MHTEVFGYSLLQEHFYLIYAPLAFLRRLLGTTWVLVLAHALVLWAAIFPLRAVLAFDGLPAWFVNLACVLLVFHPVMGRALEYLVHPEAALPVLLLSLWWCHRTGRRGWFWVCLLAALTVKEDVGIYMLGLAAWFAIAERRTTLGIAVAAASLAWVLFVLKVAMPAFGSSAASYRFFDRWAEWGSTPLAAAAGMLSHPGALLADICGRQQILLFAGLGFLCFLSPWGWLIFFLPWVINSSSGERLQSGFSLYYGAPVLAFALVAAVAGVRTRVFRRLRASPLAILAVAVVGWLNVAHLTFTVPVPGRSAVLAELAKVPYGSTAFYQPSLYPYGGYWAGKRPLMTDRLPDAEYVVLWEGRRTWPFSSDEVVRLAAAAQAKGYRNVSAVPGLFVLRRSERHDRMRPL
jgi:uncharacterized membrane protein